MLEEPRIAPFRPRGEIDMATASELADELLRYAATTEGDVVVDCCELEFIDSAGIGAILAAYRTLRDLGRRLVVENPSPMTRRVFELSGLTELLAEADSASR